MFIYKITNIINNKVYIGLTTTTIQKRWSTHKRYAIGKYKNHPLYNAMNLYGINNFTIDKICETMVVIIDSQKHFKITSIIAFG